MEERETSKPMLSYVMCVREKGVGVWGEGGRKEGIKFVECTPGLR